jgi:uncharacterized protein
MSRALSLLVIWIGLTASALALPEDGPQRRFSLEFRSEILGETRELRIQLPKSYLENRDRTYPVFYVSDADWNFALVASTLDYLSFWGRIPEFIIVGEMNTHRNRDFVPAPDQAFPKSGGGDLYLKHIEQEWIPFVEQNFRASGRRVLFGHSFGGVLALNQLFSNPDLFDAYIALGSSVWISDGVMFKRAEAAFQSNRSFDKFLYLSVGEGDGGMTVPDGDKFSALLEKQAPPSLEWSYEIFPEENHFTNVPISLHHALAKLFPFWAFDQQLIAAAKAEGSRGVSKWFAEKETDLGWRFTPQSMELSLAAYALANEGIWEGANAIFDTLERRYPERPEILAVRASALKAGGRTADAREKISEAIALGERVNHWPDRLQAFRNFRESLGDDAN